LPLAEQVATLVSDTQTFFTEQLELREGFTGQVCAVVLTHVVPIYNANSNADLLEVHFMVHTWVKQDAPVDSTAALRAIASSDFKGYIGQFLRAPEEGAPLEEVFKVHFRGTAAIAGPAE
jgi:hypothetical protein